MLFESFVAYEAVHFSYDDESAFRDVDLPPALLRAVPKRRIEFLAGRHCAARALRHLDSQSITVVPIGDEGMPIWPPHTVGAITHMDGFAAAAVARTSDALGVGLDVEPLVSPATMHEIAAEVARPGELEALRGELDDAALLTLVFSAKECLYKCLRHVVGHFFDFHDATLISVSGSTHVFTAELGAKLGALARTQLSGRFSVVDGHVHTGAVLRA
jgi:enterobactin synthetase component D